MKKTVTAPTVAAELLTATESATVAGVKARTWWRYVSSGRAPRPIRIGGVTRWRRSDILEWIEAGCPRVVARKGVDE